MATTFARITGLHVLSEYTNKICDPTHDEGSTGTGDGQHMLPALNNIGVVFY